MAMITGTGTGTGTGTLTGSGVLVGAQYQWNTGERRLEWFGDKVADYRLRPLDVKGEPPVSRH